MQKLCFSIDCEYVAEPIVCRNGSLLGVEVLTRFSTRGMLEGKLDAAKFIIGMKVDSKRQLLLSQLHEIKNQAAFFLRSGLVCSINIDFDMAGIILKNQQVIALLNVLPFVRLEISENFPNLSDGIRNPLLKTLGGLYHLWLDDLGAGNSNMEAVQAGCFECVKIDKNFFWEHGHSRMFPILIRKLSLYTKQIIVEGVESEQQLKRLKQHPITGTQGYLNKAVPLCEMQTLLQ
ncbi:EAL domain-containing protein [Ewingella sp. S1.OA.A_B6]